MYGESRGMRAVALAFGFGVCLAEAGEHRTAHRERAERAEQTATAGPTRQGTGQAIEGIGIHFGFPFQRQRSPGCCRGLFYFS